jgi:hypothetical protein
MGMLVQNPVQFIALLCGCLGIPRHLRAVLFLEFD